MDLLINAANVFYVIAYFTTDMLRLRLLTMVAAAFLATYFYCQPEPMLNVVAWNLFFLALNVVQLGRLMQKRSASPA
jgi:Gpi18-like mannosyltransferase